jgi:hypothetical protein
MNKEESDLIIAEQNKSTEEILKAVAKVKSDYKELCNLKDMRIAELEQENAEQKAQISVLLSCENCPENKGGYICEKEYNDKCLAQKIQYIKELKQENAELKERNIKDCKNFNRAVEKIGEQLNQKQYQLIKAKELLKKIEKIVYNGENEIKRLSKIVDILAEAEQFLKELENERNCNSD